MTSRGEVPKSKTSAIFEWSQSCESMGDAFKLVAHEFEKKLLPHDPFYKLYVCLLENNNIRNPASLIKIQTLIFHIIYS